MSAYSGVLLGGSATSVDVIPRSAQAWRWVSWFGLVLALAGLSDWVLLWTPLRLGMPEWEFGTIVAAISGLPLITLGFAGLLGAAVARGIGWQIKVVSVALLVWMACILTALALFLLDIPIALGAVSGIARVGIVKAIVKTLFLGSLFSVAYLVAAVGALRWARTSRTARQ